MASSLNGVHTAAMRGLPEGPYYCWVEGKAPKYDSWNRPSNLLTPEQVLTGDPPAGFNPTGFGLTSGRWSGTLAVDFDAKPERPEQSEATFRNVTGHSSDDLPPSATVVSGRPGRRRVILKVPAEWNALLSGYSAKLLDLEFRWEGHDAATGAAKPIQSVICGPHPDSAEWFFRWQDGLSPEQVGIAEAPIWLLGAMVRQKGVALGAAEAAEDGGGGRAPGEPGPCDLLDPKNQKRLLVEMSKFWPYRGGLPGTRFQASWDDDGFSGLLGALYNLLGAEMAFEWLAETDWFKSNENWGPTTDFLKAVKSVGKSSTSKKAGWGSLWRLAVRTKSRGGVSFKEPGMIPPKWALPPREVDPASLGTSSLKVVDALKKGLAEVDKMDDPLQRLAAQQELTRSLGKSGADMTLLLEAMEGSGDRAQKVTLTDLLKQEVRIRPVIHGLLARGCVTLVASEGGLAKTSLCYRMAAAIATGSEFAGKLKTERGAVVVVQKDESSSNAQQKAMQMDLDKLPEDREEIAFYFDCWHPGMFPELAQWIDEVKPVAVFMDSLGTLFGGGGRSLNESEIALSLYRLNRLAAEKDVAVVVTHHTKKAQDPKRKKGEEAEEQRKRVRLGDLYGNSYIVNSVSDVWGMVVDGGTPEEPVFALEVLKPRSNITRKGDLFHLQGNLEDLSFAFASFNYSAKAEELTGTVREKVLKVVSGRRPETAVTAGELVALVGANNQRAVERALQQLYADRAQTGVDRVVALSKAPGAARKPFGYFGCR